MGEELDRECAGIAVDSRLSGRASQGRPAQPAPRVSSVLSDVPPSRASHAWLYAGPLESLRAQLSAHQLQSLDLAKFGKALCASLLPGTTCGGSCAAAPHESGRSRAHPTASRVRDLLPLFVSEDSDWCLTYRGHAVYRGLVANGDEAGRRPLEQAPCGLDAWLAAAIVSLNTLWVRGAADRPGPKCFGAPGRVTLSQVHAFWAIERRVEAFLSPGPQLLPQLKAKDFLATRATTYDGGVVRRAETISWEQVRATLPPFEKCASLDILDLCDDRMKEWFLDPMSTLVPLEGVKERPRPGKVLCEESSVLPLARGLLERGLVVPLRESDLLLVAGKPLLNGLFGVGKGAPAEGDPLEREALRLIMNLTATNSVSIDHGCDIGALPYYAQWRSIIVGPNEELVWSYDDLKGAFYLFKLPSSWAPLFAFDAAFSARDLQLGEEWGPGPIYLGAITMPMGYKNAMGLVQYVHRRMLAADGRTTTGLPRDREIRKDRAVPALVSGSRALRSLWQVYCDDADYAELIKKLATLEAPVFAQAARTMYSDLGAPLSAKCGTQVQVCKRLGALVDGKDGRVRLPPERAALLAQLTAYLLTEAVTLKELQVVMGHWCHAGTFRRECATVHTRVWRDMLVWPTRGRERLSDAVAYELVHALCMLPLHEFDLRAAVDFTITCSDASETGGGACYTRLLKPAFVPTVLHELAHTRGQCRDAVGLIELFAGIGGSRMALEHLGVDLAVHAAAEIDENAQRVLKSRWPDAKFFGDVKAITLLDIKQLLGTAPHLRVLFVTGGSPCQGVTRVNVEAQGWHEERTLLVEEIPRIAALVREAAPSLIVLEIIENVASMSTADRERFSSLLQVVPVELCSSECSPVKRPRLYWITFPLRRSPEFSWEACSGVLKARLRGPWPAWADLLKEGAERPRGEDEPWATFMRPIPRVKPPVAPAGLSATPAEARNRWEADGFRYPPYQYKSCNLVQAKGGELRPLCSSERSVRLGFPWKHCAAATPKKLGFSKTAAEDVQCGLCGNSFSVPVVAFLLGTGLVSCGLLDEPPTVSQCWGNPGSQDRDFLGDLGGKNFNELDEADVHRMACETMVRSASFMGSDVRLATGTLINPSSWPRRGIEANRWRWKICLGYPQDPERQAHINVLEMEALLATFKWKSRGAQRLQGRVIHFCDSQVCIAVACKGRSSSFLLQRLLSRLNALLLATSCHPYYVYVRSELNPADAPSRWWA